MRRLLSHRGPFFARPVLPALSLPKGARSKDTRCEILYSRYYIRDTLHEIRDTNNVPYFATYDILNTTDEYFMQNKPNFQARRPAERRPRTYFENRPLNNVRCAVYKPTHSRWTTLNSQNRCGGPNSTVQYGSIKIEQLCKTNPISRTIK